MPGTKSWVVGSAHWVMSWDGHKMGFKCIDGMLILMLTYYLSI